MSVHAFVRRASRAAIGLGLASLLAGCFFAPGKFNSQLDLKKGGSFTFAYRGEIYMLALSRLAEMGKQDEAFTPEACHDDNFNERECTAAELEKQRADWESRKSDKKAEDARNMQTMQALMGGIDPSDPKAAQEIADRLSKQNGWHSVKYEGDGLYMVDFSVTSRMSHDFVFPLVEGFPMANDFVTATVRADNAVRIQAPGFYAGAITGQPMAALMEAAGQAKNGSAAGKSQMPKLDGTFTVTTDGTILANNTDDGPKPAAGGGQQLTWIVNSRTANAPMALIRLGN